jgi:hypothetical protein
MSDQIDEEIQPDEVTARSLAELSIASTIYSERCWRQDMWCWGISDLALTGYLPVFAGNKFRKLRGLLADFHPTFTGILSGRRSSVETIPKREYDWYPSIDGLWAKSVFGDYRLLNRKLRSSCTWCRFRWFRKDDRLHDSRSKTNTASTLDIWPGFTKIYSRFPSTEKWKAV